MQCDRTIQSSTLMRRRHSSDIIYTTAPEGYEGEGFAGGYSERLRGAGMERKSSRIGWHHSSPREDLFEGSLNLVSLFILAVHVDDFATTGPEQEIQKTLKSLQDVMLLKLSDPLGPSSSTLADPKWHSFLSRERCWVNGYMLKRVSTKFVNEAEIMLGLTAANPTSVPGVKFTAQQVEVAVPLSDVESTCSDKLRESSCMCRTITQSHSM